MRTTSAALALVCIAGSAGTASPQDMEPRAYSASPVGVNFLVVSYSRSSGSVVFDPSLPLSDVRATVDATVAGLGHTFNLFGKLALISAATPYVLGDVTGNVGEDRREVTRSGLADSRIRLSVNLRGNDATSPQQFGAAPRRLVLGASLTTTIPASQYSGSARCRTAAIGHWGVAAREMKSSPASWIWSPWLIQTIVSRGTSWKIGSWGSSTRHSVRPYSPRAGLAWTRAPRASAASCKP